MVDIACTLVPAKHFPGRTARPRSAARFYSLLLTNGAGRRAPRRPRSFARARAVAAFLAVFDYFAISGSGSPLVLPVRGGGGRRDFGGPLN